MKKFFSFVATGLIAVVALAGCEGNKQLGGGLVGAGLGGLVGSQFGGGTGKLIMTGVGVLAGALVGSSVGQSLDRADQLAAQRNTQQALETAPTGQVVRWQNPDNGNSGYVRPTRTYQTAGQYCREYQQTVIIGGREEQAFGKACRQPDGQWKVVQ